MTPKSASIALLFLAKTLIADSDFHKTLPAQPPLTLGPESKESVVGAQVSTGWLLVPVKIEGQDAGWFQVATGWADSAIDPRVAERLKLRRLPVLGLFEGADFTRSNPKSYYRAVSLQCGDARSVDVRLESFDLREMSQEAEKTHGHAIAGVLGWDLLQSLPFTIEYGAPRLTWLGKPNLGTGAHREDLLPSRRDCPIIRVTIGESVPAEALINTAFYAAAAIRPGFLRNYAGKIWTGPLAGGGGVFFNRGADDDAIPVATNLPARRRGALAALGRSASTLFDPARDNSPYLGDLQLGYGWLRQFRLTFDGPSGVVWTEPAEITPELSVAQKADRGKQNDYVVKRALAAAIDSDDVATVRALLAAGVPFQATNPEEEGALAWACLVNSEASALALLEVGAQADPLPGQAISGLPLVAASAVGNVTVMKRLLEAGAQSNRKTKSGYSALMKAALSGGIEARNLLLKYGTLPTDPQGTADLFVEACAGGDLGLARQLWRQIPVDSERRKLSATALSIAAQAGQLSVLGWLLENGAPTTGNPERLAPMLAAIVPARVEKSDAVRRQLATLLLAKGADANVSSGGLTPLLLAARHGDPAIVAMLVKAGAKTSVTDLKGRNVLHRAAAANQPVELLVPLLNGGVSVNDLDATTDRTPLGSYAWHGNTAACRVLLEAGADPNVSSFTSPALLFAANGATSTDADALATIKLLLSHGARASNDRGTQAGHLIGAIAMGRTTLIEPLMKLGKDVDQPMFQGVTPLLLAAAISTPAVVAKLLELGASPKTVDEAGHSAAAHAAAAGRLDNLELVLKNGASPNPEDAAAVPPLCAAATCGQLSAVRRLLLAGADPKATDPKSGQTPLTIATNRADALMAELLMEAEAKGR